MAHEVHPKKIVETDKGKIVLEMPDMYRQTALSNAMYTYMLTDDELLQMNEIADPEERERFMKVRSLKKGYTMIQLTVLSYITSAPFHLNDYRKEPMLDLESFLDFVDKDLFMKLFKKTTEIGTIDPLSA